MVTVVFPLLAFMIRISGLLFKKVRVDLMSWIILFCESMIYILSTNIKQNSGSQTFLFSGVGNHSKLRSEKGK